MYCLTNFAANPYNSEFANTDNTDPSRQFNRKRIKEIEMHTCKKGEIYRTSYTRTLKNGKVVHIKGRCIRSQSPYPKPYKVSHIAMRGYPISKRTLKHNCPKGYKPRRAYVRSTRKGARIHVPEHCIKDRRIPGKGFTGSRGIGPLRKGELSKYGYQHVNLLTKNQRHEALRKAVQEFGSLSVWRKLNAVAVYTKHTSPSTSRIFKEDMNWITTEFGRKAF